MREIADDRILQYYGAVLCILTSLTAAYWAIDQDILAVLSPESVPVCWPFLPYCDGIRPSPIMAALALVATFSLGLAGAIGFMIRRTTIATAVLIGGFLLKSWLLFTDFRLTLNHHYMIMWVTAAYLLCRQKRAAILVTIVVMYFTAGILKLDPNAGWLSGVSLLGRQPLGLPTSAVPLACGYVVVLETILVWCLLSPRPRLVVATLGQLALFHVASFWVVGWFYPAVMFGLISIVVGQLKRPVRIWPMPWQTIGLLMTFIFLQLPQYWIQGPSAVTGEGRVMALNMFDAPVTCRAVVSDETGSRPLRPTFVNARIMCDPWIHLQFARGECRHAAQVRLALATKPWPEPSYLQILRFDNVCGTLPEYRLWSHNSWIRIDGVVVDVPFLEGR